MRNVRMIQSACLDEKRCAHWLLAAIIIKNPLLNALLNVHSEEFENRQIHSCVHQSKRITRRRHAVKRRNRLERAQVHLHIWNISCAPTNFIGRILAAACDYETHVSLFA